MKYLYQIAAVCGFFALIGGCASTQVEVGNFRTGIVPVAGIVDEHESERKVLLKCRKAAITGVEANVQVVGKDTSSDTTRKDYGTALDDQQLGAVVGLFAPSSSTESSTDFRREDVNEAQRLSIFRLCIEESGYQFAHFVKGYKPILWSEQGWNRPPDVKDIMQGKTVGNYESESPLHEALKTQPCEDWVAECPGDGLPIEGGQ